MDLTKNEQKLLMKVNNEMYITQLAKSCNITGGNAVVIFHKLEERGLVFFKRVKNMKYVILTEEGDTTKELLLKLENQMR